MNVYGPRMDYKGAYVSVVMKVLDRIDEGQPPVIFGDGSQAYDFVHVEDVARANVLALKSDATDDSFNVGMGRENDDQRISHQTPYSDRVFAPSRSIVPRSRCLSTHRLGSTEKAQKLLSFKAQIPLDEGLQSIVEWRRQSTPAHPS